MAAINFDQPSVGSTNSLSPALSIVNSGGVGLRVTNSSNNVSAVIGINNPDPFVGIPSRAVGVLGISNSGGDGVRGETNSNRHGVGVGAVVGVSTDLAPGGWFQSSSGEGVRGVTNSDDPNHGAVVGLSTRSALAGLFNGDVRVIGGVGIHGDAGFHGAVGIHGDAGFHGAVGIHGGVGIHGDLQVVGNITKGGGGFKIDHPLDPANMFLNHGFVESDNMKNIYDGVAVLDENGEATIELPKWFEAVNQEFRYQLTAIGGPSPNLYVQNEISNNKFIIAGGIRKMKVSWQVSGTRKDPWAKEHSLPTEEVKQNDDKGLYLHPDLYNQSQDKTLKTLRFSEMDS